MYTRWAARRFNKIMNQRHSDLWCALYFCFQSRRALVGSENYSSFRLVDTRAEKRGLPPPPPPDHRDRACAAAACFPGEIDRKSERGAKNQDEFYRLAAQHFHQEYPVFAFLPSRGLMRFAIFRESIGALGEWPLFLPMLIVACYLYQDARFGWISGTRNYMNYCLIVRERSEEWNYIRNVLIRFIHKD